MRQAELLSVFGERRTSHAQYNPGESTPVRKDISSVMVTGKEDGIRFLFLLTEEKRYYLLVYLSAISNSRAFISFFGISAIQGEGKIQYVFKRTINLEMPYCAFQGAAFSLKSLPGLAWLNFKS